jgi:dynein regulatory complex protein 1
MHPCRLESDIAVLEQHLETMRATYQLNAEKLEYNYRVLLERDAGAAASQSCL